MKDPRFWNCVIGPADFSKLPDGADAPLRAAVQRKFEEVVGKGHKICLSGWDNATTEIAKHNNEKYFEYAVIKTCLPKPELRQLTGGELLKLLTNHAKDYSKLAVNSVKLNSHMNDVPDKESVTQSNVDAILVDYINYIASLYGVDYGLYAEDLKDEKKKVDFTV
jgi:hypothetical protein